MLTTPHIPHLHHRGSTAVELDKITNLNTLYNPPSNILRSHYFIQMHFIYFIFKDPPQGDVGIQSLFFIMQLREPDFRDLMNYESLRRLNDVDLFVLTVIQMLLVTEWLIVEINSHLALFRDLLIHVGQSKDCPELREKIRKLRRTCVEAFKHTQQILMPQVKSATADGILTDNPHLVLLFYMAQLFLRELVKSYRLIQVVPMDMSGYYENRAGPSNLGNVISQILLCKQITPDFNQEELCSITKDSQDMAVLLSEMQEFMPQHETYLERQAALENNGPWPNKERNNYICKNMSLLCCVSRPNYL